MTVNADLIYIIHGSNAHTWWRRMANGGYPWWRRWSLFNIELRRTFDRDCEIKEFVWSGLNTHDARQTAGAELARRVASEAKGRKVHLVGHSHGGNVALVAANQLPPNTLESVILLANPNIVVLDSRGKTPEWLYWGDASARVPRVWTVSSPQDLVQCGLVRLFHGIPHPSGKSLQVRPFYGGFGENAVRRGEVHWSGKLAAHRALHSGKMGAVVGSLLNDTSFSEAMNVAGLSIRQPNAVRDRGGWPGRHRTEEMIRTLGNPRPFDLGNAASETALLFIHGFTASPAEMRPMAASICSKTSWRCVGPLLPGHGTHLGDMENTSAEEWVLAVEAAYESLCKSASNVFLVGLSLGAVLACEVALRRRKDPKLRGMVLMAPAFGVHRWRALGVQVMRPVRKLRDKGRRASDYFLDNALYTYLYVPLNRAAELLRLGQRAMAQMSKLEDLPTIMFIGDRESTVSLTKMESVAQKNPWIRLIRLPRSRHILPVEPDREMLFEASRRFVEECLTRR